MEKKIGGTMTTLALGEEENEKRRRVADTTQRVGEESRDPAPDPDGPTPYVKDGEDQARGAAPDGAVPHDNPLGSF